MAKRLSKKQSAASELLEAIKFINLAQRKEGESYKLHCKLQNNFATAFDGVIACGHKIEDSLDAQPRTEVLLKALAKCGNSLSITHVDNQLAIVSGKFKVFVPCDPNPQIVIRPDPPCAALDARLAASLAIVGDLPEEGDERTACRSVLIQAGSVVGCRRGHVIIEAWHGIELPPGLCVPVRAIKAILDSKKELTQLGFSASSVTFYFSDGSWIRSQLDEGKWPDYQRMLNLSPKYETVPGGLFDGLQTLKDFSEDKRIRLKNGSISTHSNSGVGASVDCDEISGNATFATAYLEYMKDLATEADFYHDRGCFFIGERDGIKVRGAIAKMVGE